MGNAEYMGGQSRHSSYCGGQLRSLPREASKMAGTLNIKAMRVCKPPFRTAASTVASSLGTGMSGFPLSALLEMPAAFGEIYCGQQFSCFIHISNGAQFNMTDVQVRVAIKSGPDQSQAELLPQTALGEFLPGNARDFVVHHLLVQKGSHLVECIVTYADREGQVQRTKKSWPFEVKEPVRMDYVVAPVGRVSLIQLSLQNLMSTPVFIEQLSFDQSPSYNLTDLNNQDMLTSGQLQLQPQAKLQLCYQLQPGQSLAPEKDPGHLGAFRAKYRGPMGSEGRIDLPSVRLPADAAKGAGSRDVQVTVCTAPSQQYVVGLPTQVHIRVTNRTSTTRKLSFDLKTDQMGGVLLNGVSGQLLEDLPADQHVDVALDMLPLQPGIQKLGGVNVVDVESFQKYEFDEIGEILVQKTQEVGPAA